MAELIMQEEASAPSTPSSGKWKAYFKASGLYVKDDAGNEYGPLDSNNVLLTTGGTSTAFTITTLPANPLTTGETFRVKFHATAGASPTLSRDGLTAKSLKYIDSTGTKQSATSTQIVANVILTVLYDGTDYVLLGLGGGGGTWGSITGTLSSQTDLWNILSTGWVNVSETWTYASASTFTVSGDLTSRFTKGTRLKLTQTTVKYFVVVSSSYSAPNTTVTVAVNTSYTIANAAITSPYYSYDLSPVGYPDYYSFTPTWTNVTVGNGTVIARYSVHGRKVKGQISFVLGTTSSISGQISVDCPITALADYDYQAIGAVGMIDTGVALYMGAAVLRTTSKIEVRAINASGTYSVWSATSGTVPHTWGSTDQLTIEFEYYF